MIIIGKWIRLWKCKILYHIYITAPVSGCRGKTFLHTHWCLEKFTSWMFPNNLCVHPLHLLPTPNIRTFVQQCSCAVLQRSRFWIINCVKRLHWSLELKKKKLGTCIWDRAFLNFCLFDWRRRSYWVSWQLSWLVFNLAAAVCKDNRRNIIGKFSFWPSIRVKTWGLFVISARLQIWTNQGELFW